MRLHAASQFEIDPPVYSDPLANAEWARFARAVSVSGCVDPENSSMVGSSAVYWSRYSAASASESVP
jgi:phage terminase small subunit